MYINENLNVEDYTKKVYKKFKEGALYRSKLVKKGIIALSGGLDSRLIAAAVPASIIGDAFTFVDSTDMIETIEVTVAAEICKRLNKRHYIEMLPKRLLSDNAKDIINLTGGLTPLHHSAKVLSMIKQIKDLGFNYLLGGGPGDIISGDIVPSAKYLDHKKTDECINEHIVKMTSGGKNLRKILSIFIREDIISEYYDSIQKSVSSTFEKESGPTAAHILIAWYMNTGMPGTVFTSPVHNHPDITETFCHIDYAFCELMSRLPAELLYKRNCYAYMIYNCFPELQDVRYANTGQPLTGKIIDFNSMAPPDLKTEYRDKVYGMLKRSKTIRDIVGEAKKLKIKKVSKNRDALKRKDEALFHYFIMKEDEELFSDITDILHSYKELSKIFNIKGCMDFIQNFRNQKQQTNSYHLDAELLGTLASFCYSFKQFRIRI